LTRPELPADRDVPSPKGAEEVPDLGLPPGRVARLRGRAELAERRYRELAQDRPIWGLPLSLAERHTGRQGVLLASAVAFRVFLWVVPLALLLAAIGAGLAVSDEGDITSAAKTAGLTGVARHEVVKALQEGHRSWVVALLIGLVLLAWASRNLARTLTLVHAHVWQAPLPRSQKAVLITGAFLDGAWFLVLLVAVLVRNFDDLLPGGIVLGFLIETAALTVIWLMLTARLPNRRTDRWDLLPGSLLFGVGFSVMHLVSRVYLPARFARSAELYGSLGIAVVILAWLLIIGELIVGAAVLNSVFAEYRQRRSG
jgi:membrane protein